MKHRSNSDTAEIFFRGISEIVLASWDMQRALICIPFITRASVHPHRFSNWHVVRLMSL